MVVVIVRFMIISSKVREGGVVWCLRENDHDLKESFVQVANYLRQCVSISHFYI